MLTMQSWRMQLVPLLICFVGMAPLLAHTAAAAAVLVEAPPWPRQL